MFASRPEQMRNSHAHDTRVCPWPGLTGVRAVLFDVDGTLYRQAPVRAAMALEMAQAAVWSPVRMANVARILSVFRRTREALRCEGETVHVLERVQYARCGERIGLGADEVRAVVSEWMMTRPLKHLRRARRSGVTALLAALSQQGLRIGALSDYPVQAKLEALGIDRHFSLQLCTVDSRINAFKPHPAGFRRACELWNLEPREVLYVGDRPEIDGVGAAAAGTQCVIVGRSRKRRNSAGAGPYAGISCFHNFRRALERR
jgi:HAD superfamily hydrolase (TIGR01549 family)